MDPGWWKDASVTGSRSVGVMNACEVGEIGREQHAAYFRGMDPGPIVGQDSFFCAHHNRQR
jgi:hypothetical protein